MADEIQRLTEELSKLSNTEAALATAIQAVVDALHDDAAKIAQLTEALAAANAQNNTDAINALIPEFDNLAEKFSTDAATLQNAVPAPQT